MRLPIFLIEQIIIFTNNITLARSLHLPYVELILLRNKEKRKHSGKLLVKRLTICTTPPLCYSAAVNRLEK